MILVEMKACGWYSPQTLLRVEQIDGDDLPAPRRTGSQISGARISSASKKPSILSGTTVSSKEALAIGPAALFGPVCAQTREDRSLHHLAKYHAV